MTKALFKKQMMEVFSWIYRDKKSGKNRSKSGIIGYAALYLFVFGFLGYIFFTVADMLCAPLIGVGLGWLFFALMGLISVALGVFGSVFSTYTSLYQAKDNDLLLSMPIPSSRILTVRLSGVFFMGLLYELIVMVPTVAVFFMNAQVGISGIVFTLLIPFVLSFLILALSCILGWVVALISSRLKRKNLITVFISLAFIAGYYYVYAQAYSILQSILANPDAVGDRVKNILFPFYHMGLAANGSVLSMLIFTASMAALFLIVYLVLSRSFMKLATANRGTSKVKYKEKAMKAGSAAGALLCKEIRRFTSSSTYMLNCGIGIVIMLIAAAALLIKGEYAVQILYEAFGESEGFVSLLGVAALCLIAAMNNITAPSVSLEGKNLWLVQVFPVSAWQVLISKLKLHLILTMIPALILTACAEFAIKPSPAFAVIIFAVVILFIMTTGLIGLCLNLKMPHLNWTDETVPIKQSMSVLLTLFGSWAMVIALGILYFAVMKYISPLWYLIFVSLFLAAVSSVLLRWLRTKGTKIFESL